LHLQKLPVIPVLKHHPPGQSSLVEHFVLSMHVAWGSGVVDTWLHLHLWLKKYSNIVSTCLFFSGC
jgi:hypothetical protein